MARSEDGQATLARRFVLSAWRWLVGFYADPHRGAALYAFLLGALPLGFGSIETGWLFAGILYALFMFARGELTWQMTPTLAWVAGGSLAYFASTLVSPLFFPNVVGGLKDVGTHLQFLILPLMAVAMANTLRVDAFKLFLWGIRLGAILGFLIAAVQMTFLGYDRAKGGMANPIPFANIAVLAAAMSLIGLSELKRYQRWIALAAAFCGIGAAILSQTRGALIALPVFAIILVVGQRELIRAYKRQALAVAALFIASFAALFVFAKLPSRFETLARGFESQDALMRGDPSTSHRAILWLYGVRAIADRPLGYGSQNAVPEVRRIAARDGFEVPPYNHLHNEFITTGVGRGIPGIVALILVLILPVVLAWRSHRDDRFGDRLAFAVMLCSGYAIFGMTNVLFSHDQLNSFFVASLLILTVALVQAEKAVSPAPSLPLIMPPRP